MLLHHIAEKTLGNGLKIIALKKNGAPIVSVQVWYKTGSAFESEGMRGISHVLEHMMFRGSANVASEEHARRVNDVGGHCNAFTAEDVTAYINSVPIDAFDMVLDLEADRMDTLALEPGLFETERKVIIEEFHTYMNNPVAKAFLEFRQEFYGKHPYALSPLGRLEDLSSLTPETCREYYRCHYRPDNAVVVVVGECEPETVFASVERAFGNKSHDGSPLDCPIVGEDHPGGSRRMQRKVEFDVPVVVVGYPAPPSSHPDALPLEILQMIAAGGETSRLHREVVRRQSLAVMAGGMNHLLRASGMSIFFAAFTPDVGAARVEEAIGREISRLIAEGVTSHEMEKVRNTTLTNRTFELYSAENICQRIGYCETIEGNYRAWVQRLDALKNLDRDALRAVANRWWREERKHVLFLTPRRSNPLLYVGGLMRRLLRPRVRESAAASGGNR